MPRIFDNIEQALLPALQETLAISDRADFCVGYFNPRGWKALDQHVEAWTKEGSRCRLLIGMQKLPQDELREALSLVGDQTGVDQQTAIKRKKRLAVELRAARPDRQCAFKPRSSAASPVAPAPR